MSLADALAGVSGLGLGLRRRRGRYHSSEGPATSSDDQWTPRDAQDNLNTIRKTRFDLELVKSFLRANNEKRPVQEIPTHELDPYLASFISSVKKKNGEDFEPGTLRGILGSVDRYFRKHDYGHAIFSGNVRDFPRTRDALAAKQRQLKREGRGNHPNRAQPITNEEVEVLYLTGQLGTGCPDALLNTVWFNNWVYFGLRGMKVHRHLRWGDILLARLETGAEYLEYLNGQSKPFRPRVYAIPEQPDRDPVAIYKLYMAKRPRPMLSADAPFYLAPNSRKPNYSDAWFKCQAAGENRLGRLMKTMVINAGLPEKKRIAYRSLTSQLSKTTELESSLAQQQQVASSSSSSSSNLHNGISHQHSLPDKNALSLSMYSLMSAESALQVNASTMGHATPSISLSNSGNLENLDVATKQLWHHYRIRGGFASDREFVLHLLQREQTCRECNSRSSLPVGNSCSVDTSLWTQQKGSQEFSNFKCSVRDAQGTSSGSLKLDDRSVWSDDHCEQTDNTRVSVSEAVMLFKEWLQEKNLSTDFEKFPKSELNDLLGQYYQDVSEEYGVEYKWATLDGIRAALEKHLSSCSNPVNIVSDSEFKSSNEILQSFSKRRRYEPENTSDVTDKNQVPSNLPKVPGQLDCELQMITTEDLRKIHASPLLTTDNPEGLLHKVWFDTSIFLGVSCGKNPSIHSLKLRAEPDGTEYYAFESDEDSNNDNGLRLYASSGSYCPLAALKRYLSKLHPGQDQLFQHPEPHWSPEHDTWYSPEPMSPDDLESVADFLLRSTDLSQCYGLLSLHATSEWIQELWESGKEPETIARLTGLQADSSTRDERKMAEEIGGNNNNNNNNVNKCLTVLEPSTSTDLDDAIRKMARPVVTSPNSAAANAAAAAAAAAAANNSMLLLPSDHFPFVQTGMRHHHHLSSMLPPGMLLPVPFQDSNPLPATVMYLKPDQQVSKRMADYRSEMNISINAAVSSMDHVAT